jgi:hypothetical protein
MLLLVGVKRIISDRKTQAATCCTAPVFFTFEGKRFTPHLKNKRPQAPVLVRCGQGFRTETYWSQGALSHLAANTITGASPPRRRMKTNFSLPIAMQLFLAFTSNALVCAAVSSESVTLTCLADHAQLDPYTCFLLPAGYHSTRVHVKHG